MFTGIKNWLVNAVSNGGAIVLVVAILVVGGFAETVQPVQRVSDFFGTASAPASPIDPNLQRLGETASDGWKCPDSRWTETKNGGGTLGAAYVSCKLQGIEIRHFVRMPGSMTENDMALDTNTYPHALITVEEAVNRVR